MDNETPKITEDSSSGKISSWVVDLENCLEEVKARGRSLPVVFRVAKAFLASEQEYYVPRFISAGPYHFEGVEQEYYVHRFIFAGPYHLEGAEQEYYVPRFISAGPCHVEGAELTSMESQKKGAEFISMESYKKGTELRSMESHKKEAVLRMQQRIPERSIKLIVLKDIVAMDKRIREFYDEKLGSSNIDLAWIVTKDSCFLFEFMLNFIRTRRGKQDFLQDCVVEGMYDTVLSSSRMNPMWKNILYDLALFENQIPLSVLRSLLAIAYPSGEGEKILSDILWEVASLPSNMVFTCAMEQPDQNQKSLHFLEVLYYRHVGWNLEMYKGDAPSVKLRRFSHLRSTKSIFSCCCPWGLRGRGVEEQVSALQVKLPSAADLKKKGVKICAVTSTNSEPSGNLPCILRIRFEEETSTLYLPEVRIDHLGHALLRNFIALEFSSHKYQPSPITTFAFFMNELLDSEEDVAVLREAKIINNFFGSNKEAAECFNAITRSYPVFEGCKPIDDARVGLHKYLTKKYKILWSEFLSLYFAKPWLVAGSIAASLILLMQALQVFCRFYACSRRP